MLFFNELILMPKKRISMPKIYSRVSLDPRIGDYYKQSFFGYGGYCLEGYDKIATLIMRYPAKVRA